MKRRRICYIHHVGDVVGGSTRSLYFLIKTLDKSVYSPVVFVPPGRSSELLAEVADKIVTIKKPPMINDGAAVRGVRFRWLRMAIIELQYLRNRISQGRIVDAVMAENPSIVHLNELGMYSLAKIFKRKGLVVISHARIVTRAKTGIMAYRVRTALNRYCDMVVCIDGSVFRSLKGVRNRKLLYNPLHRSSGSVSKSSSASGNRVVFLYLAGLHPSKGIKVLIKAIAGMRSNSAEFWIAGGNTKTDVFFQTFLGRVLKFTELVPDTKEWLELEVGRLGFGDRVKILGHVDNIDTLFSEADILVFPGYYNGPGRSVFEAGLQGIPSIVSMRDVVQDIVKHERNGLIFSEGSHVELTRLMDRMVEEEDFRLGLGGSAQAQYGYQFSQDRFSKRLNRLYTRAFKALSRV